MADNVTAEAVVTPGAIFATDDNGGIQHPYVKVEWGADNTFTKVDSGANSLPIQDGGNSITVDGTVAVTGPLAVTQSGTWDEVGINDSGNSITVDNPQLSVIGGGAEAAALRVTIATDSTGVLGIDDNGGSLTVDGSVTAHAGTNLNTSALALETGGNLATAATSLAVIDDWDESDRAKVNLIAGQVGVQGASGTVTALTQRVVLATDVGLPAGTAALGSVTAGHGKTLKSKTGTASATFTLVAAVASKKIKVYSLSFTTVSATVVTITMKDGAGGTAVATYVLQAPASVMAGIAEAVSVPSQLFETTAATLLEMSFSAAVSVVYNLRYWDDDTV